MRSGAILALVAGLLVARDGAATDCFESPCGSLGRWTADVRLPPMPTVYLVPDADSVVHEGVEPCGADARWPLRVWPRFVAFDELARLLESRAGFWLSDEMHMMSQAEPARLAWALPRSVEAAGLVTGAAGEPVPVTAELRIVGHDFVHAFHIGVAAGAVALAEDAYDRRARKRDSRIDSPLRRISAAHERPWSEVRRGARRSPWDQRVHASCRELELLGAGVGYWVVETEHCLDHLVHPADGPVGLSVPAACRGEGNRVTVVAHLIDGDARRHVVEW